MSADNYLYVGRTRGGQYGVEMRFASNDYPRLVAKKSAATFDTIEAALNFAYDKARHEYYEYGVSVADDVRPARPLGEAYWERVAAYWRALYIDDECPDPAQLAGLDAEADKAGLARPEGA